MGSDLPAQPKNARSPRFLVWAAKDPNGANLDRVQVVKVWLDGGQQRERVFDVVASNGRRADPRTGKIPAVGNTVDLKTGSYRNNIGAVQLATQWVDPTFNPAQAAVYYVRVLEIPTPRWSTILAARYQLPLPQNSPATLQERAWSSPIWFTPEQR